MDKRTAFMELSALLTGLYKIVNDPEVKLLNESTADQYLRLLMGEFPERAPELLAAYQRLAAVTPKPAIAPLGFDWKMGVGIVASFAAREVFVSTMSLVYNVGEADDSEQATQTLAQILREQTRPDGSPVYTTLVAVTLMVQVT